MAARSLVLGCTLALLLVPCAVQAGNDDGVLIGDDAVLAGGAVTATTADGSALWYNPAGIASVERNQVDVSGSAFVLRLYTIPSLIAFSTGEASDGSFVEVVSVPSALTLVRPIGRNVRVGLGVFVPESSDFTVRANLEVESGTSRSTWLLNLADNSSTNHVAAGIAGRIGSRLRVGATVFGVYRAESGFSQFWGGLRSPGVAETFFGSSALFARKSIGVELGAGLQWSPSPGWALGASVRSPGLQLFTAYRVTEVTGVASVDEEGQPVTSFAPEDDGTLEPGLEVLSPPRIRLGLAREWSGGWASIDADVQTALTNEALGVQREPTWNVRAGTRFGIAQHVSVGFGAFTDRSAAPRPRQFGEAHVDYYGVSAGLTYESSHVLAPADGASDARPRDIVFSTTFGLRYALGIGELGGLLFDPLAATDADIATTPPVDVHVHEFSLQLGSALYL